MANTPLFPALESGAKEIIVVLLSRQAYRLIEEGYRNAEDQLRDLF